MTEPTSSRLRAVVKVRREAQLAQKEEEKKEKIAPTSVPRPSFTEPTSSRLRAVVKVRCEGGTEYSLMLCLNDSITARGRGCNEGCERRSGAGQ